MMVVKLVVRSFYIAHYDAEYTLHPAISVHSHLLEISFPYSRKQLKNPMPMFGSLMLVILSF